MSAQIIDIQSFKQGNYKKKQRMTIEDCIRELDEMIPNATEKQQTALSVGINLMIEYIKGVDDGRWLNLLIHPCLIWQNMI